MARKKKRSKLGYNPADVFAYEDVVLTLLCFGIPARAFNEWFIGQTGIILPNGTFAYFRDDVERFAKTYLQRALKDLR